MQDQVEMDGTEQEEVPPFIQKSSPHFDLRINMSYKHASLHLKKGTKQREKPFKRIDI